MDSLILKAADFARIAHQGQVRKVTGMPYIVHPARVASRVMILPNAAHYCNHVEMVIAAFNHDVVEDTGVSLDEISQLFGNEVARLVDGLTNKYNKRDYPKLNRSERKKLENARISSLSPDVKLIKLLDRLDNLNDLSIKDSFMPVYLDESKKLLEVLSCGIIEPYIADFKILSDELKTTIEHLELLSRP